MISEAELERLVQLRKTGEFLEKLKAFKEARRDADSPDFKIQVSDWLRRLGKYTSALKTITGFENVPSGASSDTPDGKIRLQAAHLLNQLGASFSALQIVSQLDLRRAEDFRAAGMIALDNFEFHLALEYLEAFHRLDREPESYRSRMTELARADALSDLGRCKEALALARGLRVGKSETLFEAIRLEAQGEYLARAGQFEKSLERLRASEKAMASLPERENTVDSAFLWKWMGYVLGQLGERADSERYFKRAKPLLSSPTLRIEAYFHFLVLRATAQGQAKTRDVRLIRRIQRYPGITHGFARMIGRFGGEELGHIPTRWAFGNKDAPIQIFPDSHEFLMNGNWILGIPLELRLAAALQIAEDWGVSLARAKATLWPDEVYQFFALDNRIHALLVRLKGRYRLKTRIKAGIIRLLSRDSVRVVYGDSVPSLVRKKARFTREEFSDHYGLSPTQSKAWLARWIEQGRITRNGKGPSSHYRRL